jgi:hypothetical protein
MKSIAKRFWRAFGNPEAWILVLIGLLMFSVRTPLPDSSFINLPFAATVIQTAGLMFALFGFQIMASMLMWPTLSFPGMIKLATDPYQNGASTGAALIIFGLLVFNGLCMVAFTIWLSGSLSIGAGAR